MDARLRAYLLLALLAALVAHFVEIHFGIAIAATRTYFWVYAGLLLLVGFVLPEHGVFRLEAGSQAAVAQEAASPSQGAAATESEPTLPDAAKMRAERRRSRNTSSTSARKKRRSSQARLAEVSSPLPFWLRQGMLIGLLMAVVIFTMGYLYITNANKSDTPIQATWASLTRLKAGEAGGAGSLALLALILVSWIGGTVLLASESLQNLELERREALRTWGQAIALGLGVSLILGVIFWLWHAAGLIALIKESATTMQAVLEQVQKSEGILTRYYTYLLFLAFGLAYFLAPTWPAQWTRAGFASGAIALVSLAAALGLSGLTNLRVIQADMSFKTGDVFARPNSWPVAITIYDRARTLAPSEDYYYLFLGRAYLEYARTLKDVTERDQLIEQAARDLRKAQQINPLNTDHTANLARLYSLWAATTSDATIRAERASTSEDYFSRAVVVSPNNAKLWDEWALLYMEVLEKPAEALPRLEHALELDPYYDWTYWLLGDYYSRYESKKPGISDEEKKALLEKAAQNYSKALELPSSQGSALQYSLAVSLGGVYAQLNQPAEAIRTYEQALELSPNPSDNWRIQELLAHLYAQMGDMQTALNYARQALEGAPEDAQARLQALIAQLTG
jgi:tetratricopeptide (TPR) repeat protein